MEAYKNHLSGEVKMFEPRLYSPYLSPIKIPQEYAKRALEACNHTQERLQMKAQADLRPFDEVLKD